MQFGMLYRIIHLFSHLMHVGVYIYHGLPVVNIVKPGMIIQILWKSVLHFAVIITLRSILCKTTNKNA